MATGRHAGLPSPGRLLAAAVITGATALAMPAHAGTRYCEAPQDLSATQQDRIFRFSAVIRDELERSGRGVALIARSGLDLARFGQRYSHAGLSLQQGPDTAWSVRQLYYACDEQRPRLFDQGLAAFLLGSHEIGIGYVSVVLMPADAAAPVAQAALDNRRALAMLHPDYSANAYPFSQRYQNCNQWVLEMLASAWGGAASAGSPAPDAADEPPRAAAQRWLQARGYRPTVFDVGLPLMWASAFVPYVHRDDHPADDLAARRFLVSMPASIEAFVQVAAPGAERVEFCHNERHVVVHRGWGAIAEGCVPGDGDTVLPY